MRILLLAALMMLFLPTAHAQAPPRAFEVAAIRPHSGPVRVLRGFTASGTSLALEGDTPFDLIAVAYGLREFQIVAADSLPKDALITVHYDIVAKAEGTEPPTNPAFRQMLQALLASRFNLKFHRETREMSVYALVVGKNGPKLKESDAATVFSGNHTVNGRNQTAILTHATMDDITFELGSLDRPVVDKTGLRGFYDIVLEATPEFRINNNPQPGDISLFTAVQDSLGLKLDPQKAAVEVFVIDSIGQPTEN